MDPSNQRTKSCPPSLRSPSLTDVSGPTRPSSKAGSKSHYPLHPAVRRRLSSIENSSSSLPAHEEKASTAGDQLQVAFSHPGMPDEEYLIMMAAIKRQEELDKREERDFAMFLGSEELAEALSPFVPYLFFGFGLVVVILIVAELLRYTTGLADSS
ncbi:hypothetical protein B0T11DRAFT_338857 [Plectosphaerella cucumerina]|uniref:Uncharacterized protein n=1 Tax=Plectosphaerella cucumerina TaxID=40658 RepID=A0A8K0X4N5_9PEZI|nr:hypothetical protein B0T11DRAFT_338857 [Plectosphaerella cucumerina]